MLNETFAVRPNLIDTFQRDGAVCLLKILLPHEVASLRDGIDANLAHPSPRAKVASEPDDPVPLWRIFALGRKTSATEV